MKLTISFCCLFSTTQHFPRPSETMATSIPDTGITHQTVANVPYTTDDVTLRSHVTEQPQFQSDTTEPFTGSAYSPYRIWS